MAKDPPALQQLFKLNAGEQLSPVLCLVLFKGQMIQQAQAAFVLLLGECLHAKYLAIYPDT